MRWWQRFALSLRKLLFRKQLDAELEREFLNHLELEIEELEREGLTRDEARLSALRTFGNFTRIKENVRDEWALRWIDCLRQDLRYGAR